ncbi:cytochrome b/b6 domain-containing protein, partial [Pseudomonas sp. UBA6310]|uniref:cytochrome b/b6 domain-containing protein n=1 Tax=Pseudomonas sp. UBA6310 TaxID=1947327 RepID=UPI00257A8AF0
IGQVLKGDHNEELDTGKYNAGQKVLFWGIMGLISLLLVSGVLIWRPYFAPLFSIPTIRIGLFLHTLAGILLMLLVIGHIYLAFWVKGSVDAMSSGYVSRKWARTHHPRWYRQVTGKKDAP